MAVVGDDERVRNFVRDGIAGATTSQHDHTLDRQQYPPAPAFKNDT